MKNYHTETEYRTAALLKIAPTLFILLIVVIGIIKSCVGTKIDPMDDSINATREIVHIFNIVDSTYNGFRIVYATKNNVTSERLKEIQSRKHINDAIKKLHADAPLYFGNMVDTDIYDFAEFAVQYDADPDIVLHNIFVFGAEKTKLYARNNPKITNCATWINPSTEQGVQYLSQDDIYRRRDKEDRIYRYWKCTGLYSTSYTDERYSHFSEEDRIR